MDTSLAANRAAKVAAALAALTVGPLALSAPAIAAADADIAAFAVPGKKKAPWEGAQRPDSDYYTMNSNFYDYDNAHVQVFNYSRSAWPLTGLRTQTFGRSVTDGGDALAAQIKSTDGPVVVSAHSEGTAVAQRAQAQLDNDQEADDVLFIYDAPLARSTPFTNGILTYLPATYLPVLNYINARPTASRFDTVVIVSEYDGYADFPDRPWNLLADANALVGTSTLHSNTSYVDPSTVADQDIATRPGLDGATETTYFVRTEQLPLLSPLDDLGVPEPVLTSLNSVLKPVVDAGYSRNDKPGTLRPHLQPTSDGLGLPKLVVPALTNSSVVQTDTSRSASESRSAPVGLRPGESPKPGKHRLETTAPRLRALAEPVKRTVSELADRVRQQAGSASDN